MTYTNKVLLIYTGGTIGMNRNPRTGALEPFDFEHLLKNVPELQQVSTEIETYQFNPPIDSSDMSPELWVDIAHVMHTFQSPDSALSVWASIIPFTSPMVMMARIAYDVPTWQLLLSIALLLGTFVGFAYLSGKVYRIGILMYGKKANWKYIAKWLRR